MMTLKEDRDANSRPTTTTTFEVYVRMHNRFVASVVKVLRPFLQKTVVGKFSKAFFVADRVGRLIDQDPQGVAEDAAAFPVLFADDRWTLLSLISGLKPSTEKAPAP